MTMKLTPGLEGIPIAESAISSVDGQKGILEYRGINIEALAEASTYEETSALLLFGKLPTQQELDAFIAEGRDNRHLKYRIIDVIKCFPETGHPMGALQAAVAAIGMFYPEPDQPDAQSRWQACLRLIEKIPVVVAAFHRLRQGDDRIVPRLDLSLAGNFLYMMTGKDPDPTATRVLDVCLILHAEHTMNASTFAGRVVGSTLAHPYCVISSALGALSGPLHGGANERALQLLDQIGTMANARPTIEKMIHNKDKIMGFGHRVYKTVDPRAKILKKYAQMLCQKSGNGLYEVAVEVESVVAEHLSQKSIYPNVDFYSGLVYRELGIPVDCFTPVFAVARVAGWLAHWLEQIQDNRIFRPSQIYIGRQDQPYLPIEQR